MKKWPALPSQLVNKGLTDLSGQYVDTDDCSGVIARWTAVPPNSQSRPELTRTMGARGLSWPPKHTVVST